MITQIYVFYNLLKVYIIMVSVTDNLDDANIIIKYYTNIQV